MTEKFNQKRFIQSPLKFVSVKSPTLIDRLKPIQLEDMKYNLNFQKFKRVDADEILKKIQKQNEKLMNRRVRTSMRDNSPVHRRRIRSELALPPLNPQILRASAQGKQININFNVGKKYFLTPKGERMMKKSTQLDRSYLEMFKACQLYEKTMKGLKRKVDKALHPEERRSKTLPNISEEPKQKSIRFHQQDIVKLSNLQDPILREHLFERIKNIRHSLDNRTKIK